jgi:cytochrome c-type biogenesis protein CcmH
VNTLFWIIVGVMLIIAVLIVTLPLFSKEPALSADGKRRNLKIARQQLVELRQALRNGEVTKDQFDAQYLELQLNLNQELTAGAPSEVSGGGRWVIPLVVLFIPVLSMLLYLRLGEPDAVKKAEIQQENDKNLANVKDMIPQIIERLKQNPEDVQGWLTLGRSYLFIENYAAAGEVYAKIYQYQPDNVEILVNYANSLAMNNNGILTDEAVALIDKALKLAPDNNNVLWVAGLARAQAGNTPEAIQYWQKLLAQLPADSPGRAQILKMLAEAASVKPAETNGAPAANARILVNVAIDAAIKAKARQQDTVFIYAQALNGPKMPLAIVRKRLADLPLTVELNDSMAMQPNLHLSDFNQLKIMARVSKSGGAMPQPGDFAGSAELNLSAEQQSVDVLINQELR